MKYSDDVVARCATYLASLPDVSPDLVSQAVAVDPSAVVTLFTTVAQDPDHKFHCPRGYTSFYLGQLVSRG